MHWHCPYTSVAYTPWALYGKVLAVLETDRECDHSGAVILQLQLLVTIAYGCTAAIIRLMLFHHQSRSKRHNLIITYKEFRHLTAHEPFRSPLVRRHVGRQRLRNSPRPHPNTLKKVLAKPHPMRIFCCCQDIHIAVNPPTPQQPAHQSSLMSPSIYSAAA